METRLLPGIPASTGIPGQRFFASKQQLYKIDRSFCFWLQLVTLVTK
ncbi:hypothetical protein CPter291_3087 [Collimonas pratensis]|uniref:Uncharacterized protein n=1 Tax=Collimonas pratensis TaxID=279113 RepID=A0ABM5Z914_9BURK|nr:hypothetical protein CPter291_3087 [Collimonas pratensis]